MLQLKAKKILLPVCLCVIFGFLSPGLTLADEVNSWGGDSGNIDAGKAAAQRAAAAKRAAKKQKKAEENKGNEAKKATDTQKGGTVAK